jgi:hypothetical protein
MTIRNWTLADALLYNALYQAMRRLGTNTVAPTNCANARQWIVNLMGWMMLNVMPIKDTLESQWFKGAIFRVQLSC